jgi:lipid II:glycine glycyltransferase (peptidoglycan interpeptide bridge formation enzyme)
MKVLVKEVHSECPQWDNILLKHSNASLFLQSKFWGSFLALCDLAIPIYLIAEINGDAVASMLVLDKNILRRKKSFIKKIPYISRRVVIQQGPVIFDSENYLQILEALLDWINKYQKNNNIGEVIFDSYSPSMNLPGVNSLMVRHGYKVKPWATFYVDLSSSPEEVLSRIEHSARKGIKKASRYGVSIRKLDTWLDFEHFYLLPYMAVKNSPLEIYYDHKKLWESESSSKYYSFFVCEDSHGNLLGMLGVFIFFGVATEIASAVMPIAIKNKIPVQDIMHWDLMIFSKEKGCHTFDLAGVSPNPSSVKEANILRFKKKWGGRYIEYNMFSKQHPLVMLAKIFHLGISELKSLVVNLFNKPIEISAKNVTKK